MVLQFFDMATQFFRIEKCCYIHNINMNEYMGLLPFEPIQLFVEIGQFFLTIYAFVNNNNQVTE